MVLYLFILSEFLDAFLQFRLSGLSSQLLRTLLNCCSTGKDYDMTMTLCLVREDYDCVVLCSDYVTMYAMYAQFL